VHANLAGVARVALLILQAAVGATAVPGGLAVSIGATPSLSYLAGSPFSSYLVPGLLLMAVVGGLHLLAFALVLRRSRWAWFVSATAAFGMLIWIFVQMVIVPFSPLQAVYEAVAIAEIGLILVRFGVLDAFRSTGERMARRAVPHPMS
jgi:hypothetical protein